MGGRTSITWCSVNARTTVASSIQHGIETGAASGNHAQGVHPSRHRILQIRCEYVRWSEWHTLTRDSSSSTCQHSLPTRGLPIRRFPHGQKVRSNRPGDSRPCSGKLSREVRSVSFIFLILMMPLLRRILAQVQSMSKNSRPGHGRVSFYPQNGFLLDPLPNLSSQSSPKIPERRLSDGYLTSNWSNNPPNLVNRCVAPL